MKSLSLLLAPLVLLAAFTTYIAVEGYADAPAPVADATPDADAVVSITFGVGPDMQMLNPGPHQFITVYSDGRNPTTVVYTVGGDTPPVPPPPVPDDLRTAVKAALAVNTDSNKVKTAEALAAAYGQLIESVNKGDIKDVTSLAGAVKVFTMTMTMANSAAWQPFATVVDEAVGKCAALPVCVATLGVIIEELEKIQ